MALGNEPDLTFQPFGDDVEMASRLGGFEIHIVAGFSAFSTNERLEPVEPRIVLVEARLEPVEPRIVLVEARIVPVEPRIVLVEARIVFLEARVVGHQELLVTVQAHIDLREPVSISVRNSRYSVLSMAQASLSRILVRPLASRRKELRYES